MTKDRVDRVSLAAGLACLLVGAILGLDQLDAISLGPNLAMALLCAAAGAVLVVSGLSPARRRERAGGGDD